MAKKQPVSESAAGEAQVDVDPRDARIAELEAQLAAAAVTDAGGPVEEFPKTKYQKAPVTVATPNGYRVRRVENADEEAALGADWKDSPADLA